jgi:hypothetical protein
MPVAVENHPLQGPRSRRLETSGRPHPIAEPPERGQHRCQHTHDWEDE